MLAPFIFLGLLCVWAGKGLFLYSVHSTHDGNHHISRSFDAVTTFAEGHFPMRWAGSLNYWCGVPIFNFFYPLFYYLVILVHSIDGNIIHSLKLVDFGTFFVGTFFFYLWIKAETKDKWAALAASVVYLYAPYRFLLVFVRGSPEFIAYAVLPITLFCFATALNQNTVKKFVGWLFASALTGGLLTISHNFTVMFLMPIVFLYLAVKLIKSDEKPFGKIIHKYLWVAFAYLSSFGFGAFFIFPAILEQKYTQLGIARFLYSDHFPSLQQVINGKWDYFYSAIGTELDGMSFQLGYAHWMILGMASWFVLILFLLAIKNKKLNKRWFLKHAQLLLFLALSLGFLYLILPWSSPIWERIKIIQQIQFPWRLLGICVFSISTLFAFLLASTKNKFAYFAVLIFVCALAIYGNRNHLLPQPIISKEVHEYEDYDRTHHHRHSTTTFGDDIIASTAKGACWFETPPVSTEAEPLDYEIVTKGNTYRSTNFTIDKETLKGKKLMVSLGFFPGAFETVLNGKKISYEDCEGRVCFPTSDLQDGPNNISWKVVQTPTQQFFNYVTLSFFALWLVILAFVMTGRKPRARHLLVMGIFITFMFFRMYNIQERIGFGWDQERDANAVMGILSGDIKLIGPRVLSDAGFFLPPYFFYLLVPFYKVLGGSAYSIIGFNIFYNLVFFVSAYILLKKHFDTRLALIFLSLWAVNPLTTAIDTITWNPLLVPIISLVLMLVSMKSLKKSWQYLALGLFIGFGLSIHVQVLLLLPLFISNFYKNYKKLPVFAMGVAATFVPILLFDLKNNFLNLKLVTSSASAGGDLLSFLPVWRNFASRLVGVEVSLVVAIVIYFVILAILFASRKKTVFKNLMFVWILFPVAFMLYGKRPSEYYFNFLITGIIFLASFYLSKLQLKFSLPVLLVTLLFFAGVTHQQFLPQSFSLSKKMEVVDFIKNITVGRPNFNVSFEIRGEGDVGFRYLLRSNISNYSGLPTDPLFQLNSPVKKTDNFIIAPMAIELPVGWIENHWVSR